MKIRIAVPIFSVMALVAGFLTGGQAWADDDDNDNGIPTAQEDVILNFVVDPGGYVDIELTSGDPGLIGTFIRLIYLTGPIDLIAGQTYEISVEFLPHHPEQHLLQVYPSEAPRGEEDVALGFFGGTGALPGGVTGTVDLNGLGGDFTGILPLGLDAFFFPYPGTDTGTFVIGQESSLTHSCPGVHPDRCGFSFRGAHFSFTLPEDFESYTAWFMQMQVGGGGFGVNSEEIIDVKRNVIDPNSKNNIWVAVLSRIDYESTFDPSSEVIIEEAVFGPYQVRPIRYEVSDLNVDGLGDLLLQYSIPETGIACGDTHATLRLYKYAGSGVVATDSIRTTCQDDDDDDSDSD